MPARTRVVHAGCGRGLDTVGERVERVGRARAALRAPRGLLRRDLAGLHAVLLPRADAGHKAVVDVAAARGQGQARFGVAVKEAQFHFLRPRREKRKIHADPVHAGTERIRPPALNLRCVHDGFPDKDTRWPTAEW